MRTEAALGLEDQDILGLESGSDHDLIPITERERSSLRMSPGSFVLEENAALVGWFLCQLLGCHGYQGMPSIKHQILLPPKRGRGSGYQGTHQVDSWLWPMRDENHGRQGTVTKKPLPRSLRRTPAPLSCGLPGLGLDAELTMQRFLPHYSLTAI